MTIEKLSSLVSRLFFFAAFALLAAAVVERIANFGGYTVIGFADRERMLEFAVILLIFVLALLLREVREALRKA